MAEWYAPAPGEPAVWTCVFVGGPSAGKKMTLTVPSPLADIRFPAPRQPRFFTNAQATSALMSPPEPSFETLTYRRRPDPVSELNTGVVTYDFVDPAPPVAYASSSNFNNFQVTFNNTVATTDPF